MTMSEELLKALAVRQRFVENWSVTCGVGGSLQKGYTLDVRVRDERALTELPAEFEEMPVIVQIQPLPAGIGAELT